MGNPEPEWVQKQMAHNAVTILSLALVALPPIVFGILYWTLDYGTGFGKSAIIGLAGLAAVIDFLLLYYFVKKLKGKDKTIG